MPSLPPPAAPSSLPPPLRLAVQATYDVSRIVAWSCLLGELDPALKAHIAELEHERARLLGAWKAGELSPTEATAQLRHVGERFLFHLRALENGG